MNQYKIMGALLRHNRLTLQIDQAVVAASLRTTQQTVSRWERGISRPRYNHMHRVAKVYAVDLVDLLRLAKYNVYVCSSCGKKSS